MVKFKCKKSYILYPYHIFSATVRHYIILIVICYIILSIEYKVQNSTYNIYSIKIRTYLLRMATQRLLVNVQDSLK